MNNNKNNGSTIRYIGKLALWFGIAALAYNHFDERDQQKHAREEKRIELEKVKEQEKTKRIEARNEKIVKYIDLIVNSKKEPKSAYKTNNNNNKDHNNTKSTSKQTVESNTEYNIKIKQEIDRLQNKIAVAEKTLWKEHVKDSIENVLKSKQTQNNSERYNSMHNVRGYVFGGIDGVIYDGMYNTRQVRSIQIQGNSIRYSSMPSHEERFIRNQMNHINRYFNY
jgi:hypothetical protein